MPEAQKRMEYWRFLEMTKLITITCWISFFSHVQVQAPFHMDQGSAMKSTLAKLTKNYSPKKRKSNIDTLFFSPLPFVTTILLHLALKNMFQKSLSLRIRMCDNDVFRPWVVVDVLSVANPPLGWVSADERQLSHFRGCEVSEGVGFCSVSTYSYLSWFIM